MGSSNGSESSFNAWEYLMLEITLAVTDYDEALKARIVAHCANMAKHDRAYAVWAYKQYCEALPWIDWQTK